MPRKRIASDLATEVLFLSDRTCCICRERGRPVQIHHIDEDRNNNILSNFALLCLLCHNDTQLTGGFGRKLNSDLVERYREDWYAEVRRRREDVWKVNEEYLSEVSKSEQASVKSFSVAYIRSLPTFRAEMHIHLQEKYDSGVTSTMIGGSYEYVDILESIMLKLAESYDKEQFGEQSIEKFFSEIISSRYSWHRMHMSPSGASSSGTLVNISVAGSVMIDAEKMIDDMVTSLTENTNNFNLSKWRANWYKRDVEEN